MNSIVAKRLCSLLLILVLLVGAVTPALGAADSAVPTVPSVPSTPEPAEQHWAAPALEKWVSQQLVSGYENGELRPDQAMTRAEVAKLINTVFGFSKKVQAGFTDVGADAWYAEAVSAAFNAGFVSGYPDGSFHPDQAVSREEFAKMAVSVFPLPEAPAAVLDGYTDTSAISDYAADPVARLVKGGYLNGYENKTLRPQAEITRAEVITLLDRLAPRIANQSGKVIGISVDGNLVVSTGDVTVSDTKVKGNLLLTAGVGEGDVTLDNTTVTGTLFINGGGQHSIHIVGSTIGKVVVQKEEAPVRVLISGASRVEEMEVQSPAVLEVGKEAVITRMDVQDEASGTSIESKGTIGTLSNKADKVKVNDKEIKKGEQVKAGSPSPTPTPSGNSGGGGSGATTSPTTAPTTSATPTPTPTLLPKAEDWSLVWSDEFDEASAAAQADTNGLNLGKWGYQLGTGSDYGLDSWGNNEAQSYQKQNVSVADGKLVIEAKREASGNKTFTSGRLWTNPTFSQAYGKFEARMKLPAISGIWPAFWLMPKDQEYGGWAASGELDIMEARGRVPDQVSGTIHYGKPAPSNKYTGADYHFPEGQSIADYHTYGIEWEPGEIRWYVDGQLYQTQNNWSSQEPGQPYKYAYPAPFDKPFYLILNLAVGGNFDGGVMPPESMQSAKMEVDYVRVYELTGMNYRTPVEPALVKDAIPATGKTAVDGNYVYDTQFEKPFTDVAAGGDLDPDYWNVVTGTNGTGTAEQAELDGGRYAKVNITNGGSNDYSVQLIQNVLLTKGRYYKVSFDAKSSASRTMNVKLGSGPNLGYTIYSDTYTATLKDTVTPHSFVFQMGSATDPIARLEFNMGQNTNPVWIGKVKVEETDSLLDLNAAKTPLDNGNHIYNGSFDLGGLDRLIFWNVTAPSATVATATVDAGTRQLHVALHSGTAQAGDVSLIQKGVNLIAENDYKLTFKGKASDERDIQAVWLKKDGTPLAAPADVSLTTAMEERTVLFTMPNESDVDGQLAFLLGGAAGYVDLDDVKLVRLTNRNLGTLPLTEQFPLKNGDLSKGLQRWNEHIQGRYDGWDNITKYSTENGELKFNISSTGNNPWDVMLMQNDFNLHKGITYTVSMDARATQERDVELVIDTAGNHRYVSEKLHLTTAMQTFRFELPMTADALVSFKLLLGKVAGVLPNGAHDVFVDNVRVEQKGARDLAFVIANGDFADGLNGWATHLQGQYDGSSAATFSAAGKAAKIEVARTGNNPWDIMLMQNNKAFQKGNTYELAFTARSTTPRAVQVLVENGVYTKYFNETVQLTDETQSYRYEFTMPKDDEAGLKLLLGQIADNGALPEHQIYVDSISLELKDARTVMEIAAPAGHDIALPAPPALSPDADGNVLNQPISLTFTDAGHWSEAVTAIRVDGVLLPAEDYSVTADSITLKSSVFPTAKNYVISIKATGFERAEVTQKVEEANPWSLVWSDEFSGGGNQVDPVNGVDLSKWGYQNGTGAEYGLSGWGNNEQQYYQKQNIQVADGKLVIEAKPDSVGGKSYTSGRLWTSPTFSKQYGKFEARIKMPAGQGFWPAFWMMPKDQEYGGWASSGEIDIMEARGRLPGEVSGTIHYGKAAPSNRSSGAGYTFPAGESIAGFHTYSLEWEPGEMRWYVDGELFQTIKDWYAWGMNQPAQYAYPAPFDKPFYLILNLAVGGNFDGGVKPLATDFPAKMEVDYVRVYELTGGNYAPPVEPVLVKDEVPAVKPPVNGNYVYDVDYSQGLKTIGINEELDPVRWNVVTGTNGIASGTVDTAGAAPAAKLAITNGGDNDYSVQLIHVVSLAKGRYYKVSFDAKSNSKRSMNVKVGAGAARGWGSYSDVYTASLRDTNQRYSFIFQMNKDTDTASRLEFNMGLNTNPVWISNVKLEEVDSPVELHGLKNPLENGEHVYNGSFDLGHMDRLIFWDTAVADGAQAAVSVDPLTRFAQITVADGGAVGQDVTLSQDNLQLLQSDDYRLTFKAKGAVKRSIEAALVNKDGTMEYAVQTFNLTTAWADYTLNLTMPAGVTDREAVLVFRLGGTAGDVSLDGISLVRLTDRNLNYTGVDLYPLKNGDFSMALEGWEAFVQGAAAHTSTGNGAATTSITDPGAETWSVMLIQGGLSISEGIKYELSFDVSSSLARDIQVTLENGSYSRRFDSGTLQVGPTATRYSYEFKAGYDETLALKFILGKTPGYPGAAHDVTIGNVVLQVKNAPLKRAPVLIADQTGNQVGRPVEITFLENAVWQDAVAAVKLNGVALSAGAFKLANGLLTLAADNFSSDGNYTVSVEAPGYMTATVTQQMLLSDGNQIVNGNFSGGQASWGFWNNAADWSDWTVDNGEAKVNVHYDGGTDNEWKVPFSWSTQLFQEGIRLEANKSYELSFRAWSTVDRGIAVELNGYAGSPKVSFAVNGDAAAVYSTSIKPTAPTTLKLIFLLGNASGTPLGEHIVRIDDVVIKEVVAAPALAADSTDNKLGQSITVTFTDNAAWRTAITAVKVDGVTLEANQYTVAAGTITISASVFPSVKSYSIAVTAAGFGSTSVTQPVKTAAANVALNKPAAASSAKQAAGNAFDGNPGTRFESNSTDNEWIRVDLGAVYALDSIVLSWEGAYGKKYKLQGSTAEAPGDGDWQDLYSTAAGDGSIDEIPFHQEQTRHVRMVGIERGTPYGYSLWEFEVYGTAVGSSGGGTGGSGGPAAKTPPALSADSSANTVGQPITITFADDAAWRGAITGVKVNSASVTDAVYTVGAGSITFAASLFAAAQSYPIVVEADGYAAASVTQAVEAPVLPHTVLYLAGGGGAGSLSTTPGTAAALDVIVKDGTALVYQIDGLTGTYNGAGATGSDWYLNGLAIGMLIQAKIYYDFDGDATWDRVEQINPVATDGNIATGQFESFTPAPGLESGSAYADLVNGKVKVELSLFAGAGNGEVKVNAPTEATKIVIPYSLP